MPVRALAMAAFMALTLTACPADPVSPGAPKPTPQGASQTAAEAKRDGVPKEVAAWTLDERLELDGSLLTGTSSITTDEGVWRLTRPRVHPDYTEYGEILLLDHRREKIIKAFPLPLGLPPHNLAVTKDAVYCARGGDGGLPNSMACRIDRRTRKLTGRIFWNTDGPDESEPPDPPKGWNVTEIGYLAVYAFEADVDGVWAKESADGDEWTKLDPVNLEIAEHHVKRPRPTPS